GYPLWDLSGNVNPTVLDEIARYHEVILDANPITPYRPDVALALRARRPDIRLLAYVTGHSNWFAAQPDSTVHFPTRYWRLVRDLDGFLYNTGGGQYGSQSSQAGNINLAKRDGTGRFIVAERIADLFYDSIVRSGIWDGVFVDVFCDNMLWMEASGEIVDITRAGYPDRTAFAAAWKTASDTLASRLRRLSGPTQILAGNCAAGTKYAWFNGWMRENFPYQGGGTWSTNMYSDPGGYFVDEQRWLTPRHNFIYSASSGLNQPYSTTNMRKARFGLGTASLGTGYAAIGNAARVSRNEQFMAWWYDEYAVNLATGAASTQLQHTGWLGQPLGDFYQMVWIGATPDAVTNPGFETSVTSGWDLATNLGSTATRDTVSAPVGNASVRITCPTAVPAVPWATVYRTTTGIPVTANGEYAATFWARSQAPRTIEVVAGGMSGGVSYARLVLSIDQTWRRYQVILRPNQTATARLDLMLAGMAGDVWFDDVHFQAGANSVYRRDFQNGMVLVNPGATPQDVVMERTVQRIAGFRDPTVNSGASGTTHRVGASDALFLIGGDTTPPAAIRDLRPVPPGTPATRGTPPRMDR
ncbi:MAG: putative glycoside hydrolase, partial [Candidatus Eisenbacteria bacterium]